MASAFEALLREFGAISRARPTEEAAQYYEVGVGGGPRPGWWQEADSSQVTRQYVYDATFANAGPGYLVVLTSGSGPTEAPVFVGFALPASVPHAEATVEAALQALLDVAGVPAEHPFRSIQVPATSCPPASVE